MNQLQTSIAHAESVIDKNKSLESEIKFNNDDLADKRARLDKMTAEFAAAKFDDQIAAKTKLIQTVEIEREALYSEQTRSATQADERAKLDLKRSDLKKKQAMIERMWVMTPRPGCFGISDVVFFLALKLKVPSSELSSKSMLRQIPWRAISTISLRKLGNRSV